MVFPSQQKRPPIGYQIPVFSLDTDLTGYIFLLRNIHTHTYKQIFIREKRHKFEREQEGIYGKKIKYRKKKG